MAKSVNQKIKLLRLLEILKAESDESRPLSTNEIIGLLKRDGIECARKALYDDITLLNEYGYEVVTVRAKQNLYYILDRTFEVAELRILLDAVSSASFITKEKSKDLSNKIAALAGTQKAELLKRNTVYFDTIKHTNKQIYYIVDVIERAIADDKQVAFCYFDLDLDKKRVYRRDKARYIVNPVGLIMSGGNYYLVCYNDKRKLLTNYRVDRMSDATMEEKDRTPATCVKEFESYKTQNLAFGMFQGKEENVALKVHNSLNQIIFDKFGEDTKLNKLDDEYFTVTVIVQLSNPFFCWCGMFGDKIKILSPQSVVDAFVNNIKMTLNQY